MSRCDAVRAEYKPVAVATTNGPVFVRIVTAKQKPVTRDYAVFNFETVLISFDDVDTVS
jgi:hypothetical protein